MKKQALPVWHFVLLSKWLYSTSLCLNCGYCDRCLHDCSIKSMSDWETSLYNYFWLIHCIWQCKKTSLHKYSTFLIHILELTSAILPFVRILPEGNRIEEERRQSDTGHRRLERLSRRQVQQASEQPRGPQTVQRPCGWVYTKTQLWWSGPGLGVPCVLAGEANITRAKWSNGMVSWLEESFH